ncbi:MAG: motility protein A [Aestuariibacter sp.]
MNTKMDVGTTGGMTLVLCGLILGIWINSDNIAPYFNIASFFIVIFGTCGAVMISFRPSVFVSSLKNSIQAFKREPTELLDTIDVCVRLATRARKSGLLSLEEEPVEHPFLQETVNMLVDGYDEESITRHLDKQIYMNRESNQRSVQVWEAFSEFAPAMGMIGTLIGLVSMLRTLDQPESIGPAMAVALLTTLYGALIANVITSPIAKKLTARMDEVFLFQCLVRDAAVQIKQRQNPHTIYEYLKTYMSYHKKKISSSSNEQ